MATKLYSCSVEGMTCRHLKHVNTSADKETSFDLLN